MRRSTLQQIVTLIVLSMGMVPCCHRSDADKIAASKVTENKPPLPIGAVRVVARVVHKSAIPDPAKSDYADCLYSAEVKVLEIASDSRAPRELILMLPAFFKRTLQPEAAIAPDAVIEADIIPNDGADETRRRMQRSDDIERVDLDVYQALRTVPSSRSATSFPTHPDSYFAASGASGATGAPKLAATYRRATKAASDRQTAINRDKTTILGALRMNGGNWESWCEKLGPFYSDLNSRAKSAPGSLLQEGNFSFVMLRYPQYADLCADAAAGRAGPVRMLESLNRQLRARGIDLIVVPFPNKEEVHADVFSRLAPPDGWFLPSRQHLILQMLEADIEVIDLIQPLRDARERFPYLFYDGHDQHPADGAIQVAAAEIARRLDRYDLRPPGGKSLKLKLRPTAISRNDEIPGAHYPATQVLAQDGRPLAVPENSGSPVVIMGDSFTMVPTFYPPEGEGASLSMHIAFRSGIVPDQLSNLGNSDKAAKMLGRAGGNYLANRCALVFVFSPHRMFGNDQGRDGNVWNFTDLPPLPFDR